MKRGIKDEKGKRVEGERKGRKKKEQKKGECLMKFSGEVDRNDKYQSSKRQLDQGGTFMLKVTSSGGKINMLSVLKKKNYMEAKKGTKVSIFERTNAFKMIVENNAINLYKMLK